MAILHSTQNLLILFFAVKVNRMLKQLPPLPLKWTKNPPYLFLRWSSIVASSCPGMRLQSLLVHPKHVPHRCLFLPINFNTAVIATSDCNTLEIPVYLKFKHFNSLEFLGSTHLYYTEPLFTGIINATSYTFGVRCRVLLPMIFLQQ